MSAPQGLVVTAPVAGAPYRVGDHVRVAPTAAHSETADPRFIGKAGIVEALVFDDPARQYPQDPLLQVRVAGLGRDLFFAHELTRTAPPRHTRPRARRRGEPRIPGLSSPPGRL